MVQERRCDLAGYEGMVGALARRLACWYAPEEDLCQEGRLGVLVASQSWRAGSGASADSWVWTCAWSRMVHYRRDRRREVFREVPFVMDLAGSDDVGSADDRLLCAAVMAGCTDRQARVLRLYYGQGLTREECAARLGTSYSSALLRRALGACRRRL